jgi:hypothetical protein
MLSSPEVNREASSVYSETRTSLQVDRGETFNSFNSRRVVSRQHPTWKELEFLELDEKSYPNQGGFKKLVPNDT